MLCKYLARYLIADSDTVIHNAAVLVRDGLVERIGSAEELAALEPDRTVDLKSSILHPGFVNAHSHLELSFLHGLLKPKSGFNKPWRNDNLFDTGQ